MLKKAVPVFVVLLLALVVSGCTVTQSTAPGPATVSGSAGPGYPCSYAYDLGCFYFTSNGSVMGCNVVDNVMEALNYCSNTQGDFYDYFDGETFLCKANDRSCVNEIPTNPPDCSTKVAYSKLVNGGQAWEAVNTQEDQNTTQASISTRFISTSATTVSVNFSASASINIGGSLDAVFATIYANVHAQINASVSKTASTVVGNEVTVTIPPDATANAIYGVKVQVTSGDLSQSNQCGGPSNGNYGDVETYVPIASGWCVWISGQPPCRTVSGS